MKKILSRIRRGIEDYDMIKDGDRIAVGVSGGKDSLTLLNALSALRIFYPVKFEIVAMTLDMGFEGMDFRAVREFCAQLGVEFVTKETEIKTVLFDIRKEKNPCSLCARLRRGALNDLAVENGCNAVALGHHNDDVIETFFLSLFYEGRLNCFSPVTYLSRKDINVIRPMIYVSERDIRSYAKTAGLPVVHNPCPMDGHSKREDMKTFIREKSAEDRFFKEKMMNAIQTGLENWKMK